LGADDFRSALVAISSETVSGVDASIVVSLRVMFQFLRTQATVVARRPLLLLQQVWQLLLLVLWLCCGCAVVVECGDCTEGLLVSQPPCRWFSPSSTFCGPHSVSPPLSWLLACPHPLFVQALNQPDSSPVHQLLPRPDSDSASVAAVRAALVVSTRARGWPLARAATAVSCKHFLWEALPMLGSCPFVGVALRQVALAPQLFALRVGTPNTIDPCFATLTGHQNWVTGVVLGSQGGTLLSW
jgi:hypothetical protein